MLKDKIKILIIEDEAVIALNLAEILTKAGHNVSGMVHDDVDAIDRLAQGNIDLVLLDINLSGQFEGFNVAKVIKEKYKIPFIYITSYSGQDILDRAKIYQPSGYIVKPFSHKEVLASVEIAWYNHKQSALKYRSISELNENLVRPLSEREYGILLELIKGLSYKQIAKNQFLSVNTINTHIKNIYSKIGTHSKTEALQLMLK